MAIFRVAKTRDYTVMSNYHLRDKNLSLKAKGLLSLILSLPEDWNYVVVNGCLIGGKSALRRNPELAKADPGIISRVSDFAPNTGVIIETPGFLPHETGLQNLMLLAAMSGRADRLRARRAMIELGLDPDEKKPVWKYSLGQRQRLGFAQAFMEDPDVLILDEPFNAMDKASMEEVHDLLQRFKAQNKTVLLASHSEEDIARACDVIYEMEDGGLHLVKQ